VPLAGEFQAANASLAIAACRAFDPAGVGDDAVERGLERVRFPGRIETVQSTPLVVLDGAHNPEKMASLMRNLGGLFPGRRVICVFGVLETKSFDEMLEILAPHVAVLVATAPKVFAKPPVSAAALGERAGRAIDNVIVEEDALAAVERALSLAGVDDLVLVTGSLYLVGNVRERWYPTVRILEQGTSWPVDG
jgi:dihydrofolate synthase/folylpolyglutamate synthase